MITRRKSIKRKMEGTRPPTSHDQRDCTPHSPAWIYTDQTERHNEQSHNCGWILAITGWDLVQSWTQRHAFSRLLARSSMMKAPPFRDNMVYRGILVPEAEPIEVQQRSWKAPATENSIRQHSPPAHPHRSNRLQQHLLTMSAAHLSNERQIFRQVLRQKRRCKGRVSPGR